MVTQNAEKINEKTATFTRPPIVVVLGHVDHGKSSLLEAIREDFHITSKESGGITQHIGAYVASQEGHSITFLDTPGHELFSAMRSRGAKVADIAILVLAADESVKPQTIEAIAQAKKAGIPIIVALHKIDKPEANPERVKQELAQYDVLVESYGGNVPSVETSATTKRGIQELFDMILLVAELEDLQATRAKAGEGTIIESHLDPKRGPTATILVEDGTVHAGDYVATSTALGKIRTLEDFQRRNVEEALPSMPVVAIGFLKAPGIGEEFRVFPSEVQATAFVAAEQERKTKPPVQRREKNDKETLNIILKTDVAGSLEALQGALESIPQEELNLQVVESGVGQVGENDVKLARSTNAIILSFRVKTGATARDLAEKENIRIEHFEVIYELIEKARILMAESLQNQGGRQEIGTLHVLAVFLVDKARQVIGGKVAEGEIRKGLRAEIIRQDEVVGRGKATNVQKDKKDVSVVQKGQECGLSFEAAERIQPGDLLQFFVERAPKK